MTPFLMDRRSLIGLGALAAAVTLAPTPAKGQQAPVIDGFRSAKFGMDEKAVKAAIKSDFNLEGKAVRSEVNPLEKTTALVIEVPDLEPGGKAQVAYILGYSSAKLIQVNVVWGAPINPKATGDQLSGAGTLLRNYFAQQAFPADRRAQDQRLQDGSLLFFQGQDGKTRQVSVVLFGATVAAKEGEKPTQIFSLRLSYIANPAAPDVFQLKQGSF
jgi:hypothetical protein